MTNTNLVIEKITILFKIAYFSVIWMLIPIESTNCMPSPPMHLITHLISSRNSRQRLLEHGRLLLQRQILLPRHPTCQVHVESENCIWFSEHDQLWMDSRIVLCAQGSAHV